MEVSSILFKVLLPLLRVTSQLGQSLLIILVFCEPFHSYFPLEMTILYLYGINEDAS